MPRRIITFLLIAVLLICPYLCLGEAVGATAAPLYTASCSCCGTPTESGDKAPERPAEDEPDCLCHGAIVDVSRVEIGAVNAGEFVMACGVDPHSCSPVSVLDSRLFFSQFPPFYSGRDLCIWCALLLI